MYTQIISRIRAPIDLENSATKKTIVMIVKKKINFLKKKLLLYINCVVSNDFENIGDLIEIELKE